jgi:hypothetical protein
MLGEIGKAPMGKRTLDVLLRDRGEKATLEVPLRRHPACSCSDGLFVRYKKKSKLFRRRNFGAIYQQIPQKNPKNPIDILVML